VEITHFSETVSNSTCLALAPFLSQLHEQGMKKVALRVTLGPEQVTCVTLYIILLFMLHYMISLYLPSIIYTAVVIYHSYRAHVCSAISMQCNTLILLFFALNTSWLERFKKLKYMST